MKKLFVNVKQGKINSHFSASRAIFLHGLVSKEQRCVKRTKMWTYSFPTTTFLVKLCKPSHTYLTYFSAINILVSPSKQKKSSYRISVRVPLL